MSSVNIETKPTRFPGIINTVDPDSALAAGGTVVRMVAAQTLLMGDNVYANSTGKAAKSTTRSLYATQIGIVVGGQTISKDQMCFFDSTMIGLTAAATDQYVYVQVSGVAWGISGQTSLAINDKLVSDDDTAGRLESSTTGGNIIGQALSAAANGAAVKLFLQSDTATATPSFTTSLTSAAGFIALGAAPVASGAIRIDGATYSNIGYALSNSTAVFKISNDAAVVQAGAYSAHNFDLVANSIAKWSVITEAAGTATFKSNELVARIVGGGTSFSIRNNANAADNLLVTDAGAVTARTSLVATTGFGCNSKSAQTAFASGGALNAYGAGANGLDSGANMSALHALVVAMRAALVANGIMS